MKKNIALLALSVSLAIPLAVPSVAQEKNKGGGGEHGRVGGGYVPPKGPAPAARQAAPTQRAPEQRQAPRHGLQNSGPHNHRRRNSAISVTLKGIRTPRTSIPTANGWGTIWARMTHVFTWIIPGNTDILRWALDLAMSSTSKAAGRTDSGLTASTSALRRLTILTSLIGSGIPIR